MNQQYKNNSAKESQILSLFITPIFLIYFSLPSWSQKAIHFEMPGAYLEVEDHISLRLPIMTIEFWLKINNTGDPQIAAGEQTLFDKRKEGTGFNLRLAGTVFPLSAFGFFLPEVEAHLINSLPQKRWIHIVYVVSKDSIFIFQNGIRQTANKKQGKYLEASDAPLRIGEFLGYPGASLGFKGDLDELRIWDYARTAPEITTDMHKALQGNEKGLKLYFNFESIVNGKISDLTTHKNHANIKGSASLINSKAPVGFLPLPAPIGLRAWGDDNSIVIEWEPVINASGYKIYRGESPSISAEETPVLTQVNSGTKVFQDKTAQIDKTYFYTITALSELNQEGQTGSVAASRRIANEDYTTGVYYYPWYIPEEMHHPWPEQYVRYFMKPAQPPLLGHYSIKNKEVIKAHIDWMTKAGIDFIVSSWWGPSSREDLVLKNNMLQELEKSTLKFCVYYESAILGFGPKGIDISGPKEEELLQHFNHLEQTYFRSPSYLRINNKPVVFLYLVGTYFGNYIQAFQKVRTAMAARGISLFLIGDLDCWGKSDATQVSFLDGVSPYVMLGKNGYPVETNFLSDVSVAHYNKKQELGALNKLYIPNILPGFNNLCVPCNSGFNWPRQISATSSTESTLEYNIKVTRPFIDQKHKLVMITSWNEWHEDTQIEPMVTTEPTVLDNSPSGNGYTRGYSYAGFGFKPLNLVADLLGKNKIVVSSKSSIIPIDGFSIYPTITSDKISIELNTPYTSNIQLKILDINGKTILNHPVQTISSDKTTFSVSLQSYPAGFYVVYIPGYGVKKFIKT